MVSVIEGGGFAEGKEIHMRLKVKRRDQFICGVWPAELPVGGQP